MNPLSRWLIAVAMFCLVTVSGRPAVAADDGPVLWTGIIQSTSGAAAPADVTAYVQPPAAGGPSDEDIRLPQIAEATADRDGRFVLQARYDETVRAAEDRAGWISVLVVAQTSDGISMATDSLRFDTVHRRWSTRPEEAESEAAFTALAAGAGPGDRPAVMTLHRAAGKRPGDFHASGTNPKICYMKKGSRDVGLTQVTVGELDLAQNWGGQFNYTDTKTSTVDAGFRYEGEGGWSAGGSTSFSKDGSSESINPVDQQPFPRHSFYRADMTFSSFRMDCGGRAAEQLRPTMWTGGMRPEMASAALCDHRFEIPVAAKSTFARQTGSSQTFSGAFSIVGFTGGATSVNSRSVRHAWFNGGIHTRTLCGVSDFPAKNSRVVSLP